MFHRQDFVFALSYPMGNSLVEWKERGMVFLRQDKRNHTVKKEEKHMRAAVYYAPNDLRMDDL